MKRWISSVSVVAVTVASAIVFAQATRRQGPPPGVPVDSSWSQMVSPTVVATTMVRTLDGANSLNLMVLWRGSNGWFVKPGARGGGGGGRGGSQGTLTASVRYAGLDLLAELDLQPRAVRIQSNPATLQPIDANVILVDEIEGPNLRVVSTLKIDPTMTPDKQIEPLLRRSPEILKFLQCDQKVDNPAIQPLVERSCQSVMGK
jgi:hypothetical protein